jgi:hypothetical protein
MKQKIYTLFSLLLFVTLAHSQNFVYFREGFQPGQGEWETALNNSTAGNYLTSNGLRWYSKGGYRTNGATGACVAQTGDANHLRFGNFADSGFIVTPIANFGINTLTFYNGRASRRLTIYKSTDTLATAPLTSWTFVAHFPTTNAACDFFTVNVNDANAKRLLIIARQATDTDIDSVVMTSVQAIAPVKYGAMNAIANNGAVRLTWDVVSEVNTDKYYIERSTNGTNFEIVGALNATNANRYNFVDNSVANIKTGFYRIRAVDKDGTISLSNIIRVNLTKTAAGALVSPNPVVNGVINVQLTDIEKSNYTFNVFDITGKRIFTKSVNVEAGSSTQSLELGTAAQKGVYQLVIANTQGLQINKRVVVQ